MSENNALTSNGPLLSSPIGTQTRLDVVGSSAEAGLLGGAPIPHHGCDYVSPRLRAVPFI